jgi:hypothetical protein
MGGQEDFVDKYYSHLVIFVAFPFFYLMFEFFPDINKQISFIGKKFN